MNVIAELRRRFSVALSAYASGADLTELADTVRVSQEPKFGDYQANCAMPLGKRLKRNPREVAQEIIAKVELADLCQPPEIAGPGFINLRLKESWLADRLHAAVADPRLSVEPVATPRTYVIDYSAPNVAKPMHVGHIRSTVIGDSLYRTLKFLGHNVIGDNHLGDWGTQFGMIIYGFKNFLDDAAYRRNPVDELARLYRLVNRLVDYYESQEKVAPLIDQMTRHKEQLAAALTSADTSTAGNGHADAKKKEIEKTVRRIEDNLTKTRDALLGLQSKLEAIQAEPGLLDLAEKHPDIGAAVLAETVKLHQGDPENLRLWQEFMPPCLEAINVIYRRVGVTFDVTLGESFYHDRLASTIEDLRQRGLAKESEGALCVFVEGSPVPMIVQKKDGAYLYATTDLATIKYRMETWHPDAILYVVDHRQSLHFEHLFAVARLWGCEQVEFQHVSFGTVLGEDGRPYKTRSGDTVGLTGLLDEAVAQALEIVSENDDQLPGGPQLSPAERQHVAEVVGISAIKYADLAHNRTSDYTFSYKKMLAMNGNTATYMQYAYARVRSIFRRGEIDVETLRTSGAKIQLDSPAERALAMLLLRLSEGLADTVADYRPNHLTDYLFTLANAFSTFFEQCPVLKAESPELRNSRLLLCDLTARTLKQGLELLGITVVEKM